MSRHPDLFAPSLRDLDNVPPAPGKTDTSRAAAEYVAPRLTGLRKAVYDAVAAAGSDGIAPERIAEEHDIWLYTVKPRLTELRKAGLIADSGRRIKNSRGRDEIVWITHHHTTEEG
jgi:hypothetical protein